MYFMTATVFCINAQHWIVLTVALLLQCCVRRLSSVQNVLCLNGASYSKSYTTPCLKKVAHRTLRNIFAQG